MRRPAYPRREPSPPALPVVRRPPRAARRAPPTPRGSSRAAMQVPLQVATCGFRGRSQIRLVRAPDPARCGFRPTPRPSLPNTCSPRRSPAARASARCASWCARPSTRPPSSRRWVRHRLRSGFRPGPPPPPRASTRTAGHSVVTRAGADQDRSRPARRSASRRYPITRHAAPDHPAHRRPVWEDGRAGRAYSSNALGPPYLAARAPWSWVSAPRRPVERRLSGPRRPVGRRLSGPRRPVGRRLSAPERLRT